MPSVSFFIPYAYHTRDESGIEYWSLFDNFSVFILAFFSDLKPLFFYHRKNGNVTALFYFSLSIYGEDDMGTLLFWGRAEREYSRNRMVVKLLQHNGWQVEYFHPLSSKTGCIEAYFKGLRRPDAIWVPCFRQTDIASAAHWSRKWQVPLVVDPLISSYQKEIFEKRKYAEGSSKAEKLRKWEAHLFDKADLLLADTDRHGDFFSRELQIAREKIETFPVGAEEDIFREYPKGATGEGEVLFYGSFLELQGVEVIVDAALQSADLPLRWTLLGEGKLKESAQLRGKGASNIAFEGWVPYEQLPARMAQADILLGIFGTTPKAAMVMPNKFFQAMAVGRPLITMDSTAYPDSLRASDIIGWVPPGDASALADCVRNWYARPELLADRGHRTRELFDHYFSEQALGEALQRILNSHGLCP